ncbi:phycobilisome linker polypeptide [Pseudanabaena yagii]|uniref:Photosystem I reaction center subunit XII n=1 Tax=Pseudanabaena yagii GIHE-NHR1 TaxID=2722753 RepID=A0ABX1LMH9_9CYAN|nr:phycobilisome linker polypeptide [Pseudanabaena yagii]NMF56503.1 photosystem I reaction center subunit XII [Pseudanabaena yagii GIHE-NHR1]
MITSAKDNRVFVYEVSGLRQSDATDLNGYPIRNSSSIFVKVPFSRLNEQTRRITRLGGTIVDVRPLNASTEG